MEYSDYVETRVTASTPTGAELLAVSQGGVARKMTAQQMANLAANAAWTETVAGTVQRSSQAQAEAIATRAGLGSSSGQDNARAPSELGLLDMLIKLFNTAITWVAQQTFTVAPILSSTTASQFLKTGTSKETVTVAASSQSDMITGTDDTKPATAKSVEDKRSIKLRAFSNSATGSSTIDCLSAQEATVVYTTTVTGGITIEVSNATNLEILHVIIPITGANITITTPSTTRMARYNEVSAGDGWYESSKILQVSSIGTADLHELSFKRASSGPVFLLRYDGPARA